MWRIIALDKDGREVARAELGAGEVTIGRDPDRQIQLNSASVSRRHARIVASGAQLLVFDDGSANGILVNGQRLGAPTPVDARSRIDVADFRITVEPVSAEATPSVAPLGTASVVESLRLIAVGGPYDGRVFPVIGEVMVGRAAENQLVLDDPSLSRKHARLRGSGHTLEVDDQGSSNGTFVNGRKVGRTTAGPGDTIRFGELTFRIEDERGMGRRGGASLGALVALVAAGGVTVIIVITAMVVTLRKPPVVKVSGKDAIAKIAKQAELHFKTGKERFGEKRWADAKSELDTAIELDPANVEARRLQLLAAHAPEDERELQSAYGALDTGDRRGLDTALRMRDEISIGSAPRQLLEQKLEQKLLQFGHQSAGSRDFADAAWALCCAYEIDPAAARADGRAAEELHEAEKRLARDRGFQPCRAAR